MHKVTLQTGVTNPGRRREEGCGCTSGVGGICWCWGFLGELCDHSSLAAACWDSLPFCLSLPSLLTTVTPGITAQMFLVALHFRGYLQRQQSKGRLRGQGLECGWHRRVIPSCCHIYEAEGEVTCWPGLPHPTGAGRSLHSLPCPL